jgi:hypothetical protein
MGYTGFIDGFYTIQELMDNINQKDFCAFLLVIGGI